MSQYPILHPLLLPRVGLTDTAKLGLASAGIFRRASKKAILTLRLNLFLSTAEPVLREALTKRSGGGRDLTPWPSQKTLMSKVPHADRGVRGAAGTT